MAAIERHPPERRANRGVVVACTGSCCCCCCCCLHTLGGIVGAAVASPSGTSTDGASQASSAKAAHTYWLLLVALCGLIAAGGLSIAFNNANSYHDRWLEVALMVGGGLVVGLPLVQIAVSVAAVILIAINWPFRFADKRAALKRIGRITRHTITGTMVGVIIMFIMWYLMIGLN